MKWLSIAVVFTLLFSACSETEEETLRLPAKIKGKVLCVDEFGLSANDHGHVEIRVLNSMAEPAKSDADGNFELNLHTGTYNISLSKEGFGTTQYQGINSIGGEQPFYLNVGIYQKSSTSVDNLSLRIDNGILYVEGVIKHKFPYGGFFIGPKVLLFLSSKQDVSDINYEQVNMLYVGTESGSFFSVYTTLDEARFKSGQTLYAKAYGVAVTDNGYVDIETNKTVFSSIGTAPLETASIQIP